MATTHIEFERIPDAPEPPDNLVLIQSLRDEFEFVYRDYDKAGDVEDAMYYAGKIDAIHDILVKFGWRRKMDDEKEPEVNGV